LVKSYDEAMALLRADKIRNGFTIVALYWLAAHGERLRREWR
jgi:ADP-ribose pyrophosphatase